MSRQSEKLVVVRGANRVKTLFLSRDVFIEIWFLNINWTQNLFFGKYFFLHKFKKFCFRNLPERKTLSWKPDILETFLFKFSLYRKTSASESDSFFRKISFRTLIFNERVCYKVMPLKMRTQSEKLVVVRGAYWVKTFFSRCDFFIEIWFLNKNWTQNIIFGNYFFSTNWLFKKFCFRNLPERKTFNWKPDILEFFVCSESDYFFSENFISNSDFQWKSLLQSHAF